MRIALAAATAAALLSAPAVAAPYADIGEFATFSFGVTVSLNEAPPIDTGETFTIGTSLAQPGIAFGGTEELASVDNSVINLLGGLSITMQATAGANSGQTFAFSFDRSLVTDPAETNGLGAETGTITFTLGNTTFVNIGPVGGSNQSFQSGGLLIADDGGTFYGAEAGSWSFGGSINTADGTGGGTFTISVPPDLRTVSEPGLLALAGVGLIGIAVARRRV